MQNPYSLLFGKVPSQLIARVVPMDEVVESFTAAEPMQQIYVITGVRGVGKTVFLTAAGNQFKKRDD